MPRLLLVAERFHPFPVTGAVRPSQAASLLPDFGWDVDVLTYRHGTPLEDTDAGGISGRNRVRYLDAMPSGQPVASSIQVRARKIARVPVRWFSVPDVQKRRIAREHDLIFQRATELGSDLVMTTSPDHSIHLVGAELRSRARIPWVAEFRDPFLGDYRYGARTALRLRPIAVRSYDAWVHRSADAVVHAIPSHHASATSRYPDVGDRFHLITNGVPDQLSVLNRPDDADGRIVISGFASRGPLLKVGRVLSELNEEGHPPLSLVMIGDHEAVIPALRGMLEDRLLWLGRVPHATSLREVARARVLVSAVDRRRSKAGLSSKLFEYMASGAPIVAINPTSDDRRLLELHPAATVVEGDSREAIHSALVLALEGPRATDDWRQSFAEQFSRRTQARALAEVLHAVLE